MYLCRLNKTASLAQTSENLSCRVVAWRLRRVVCCASCVVRRRGCTKCRGATFLPWRWRMVKNFGSATQVTFQVVSDRCHAVPTHWVGRSVPCAGEDCPMCGLRQPRQLYFCGLWAAGKSAVYEVPESIGRVIWEGTLKEGPANAQGVVITARRDHSRSEWHLVEACRRPLAAPKIHQQQVAAAVAELYRLEKPMLAETFVEWFERTRSGQAVVLQAAVLPFGGEKSSHQMLHDRRS